MNARLSTAAVLCAICFASGAPAQEVDFSGATIEFIVPYGPGGGSSVHARLIASLLEEELPGEPTILVRNVDGGGSIRGLNRFANKAKPDGLTIAALGTASYFNYILNDPSVAYPLPEFIPILASPSGFMAYGRRDFGLTGDPQHDVRHLRDHRPVVAGDDPGSADMPVMYCYDLLGIEVDAVWGVSRGEARQAFLRGETQVNHDSASAWEAHLLPMFEEGLMVPVFTMGYRDASGTYGPDPVRPEAPGCPDLHEIVYGRPISGVEREVYDALYAVRMLVSKAVVLPPGTPEEIVGTYRAAIARVVARPEFDDPVVRQELGGYPQLIGDAAVQGHREASTMSPEAKRALLTWLDERWGLRF